MTRQALPCTSTSVTRTGIGDGSFLDRNGLAQGQVYAWKADNGDLDPQAFNGVNEFRRGTFVAVAVQDLAMAGMTGYDGAGYLNSDTLQASADTLGCFSFSRPEDLATNPLDGTQAVFAATGRGSLYPADNWGTVYTVDVDFSDLTASLTILHDAGRPADPRRRHSQPRQPVAGLATAKSTCRKIARRAPALCSVALRVSRLPSGALTRSLT